MRVLTICHVVCTTENKVCTLECNGVKQDSLQMLKLLRLELSMCLHFQKQFKVLLCEQGEEKAQYLHQAQASKRHSQYGMASVAV